MRRPWLTGSVGRLMLMVMMMASLLLVQGQESDSSAVSPSLYIYDSPENEPVIEYKGEANVKGDFTKSNKPRVVVFYGPFCPACHRFKDVYVELARAVAREVGPDAVEFYAISCIPHKDMCDPEKFALIAYPSLVTFTANDGVGSRGKSLTLKDTNRVNDLLTAVGLPRTTSDAATPNDKPMTIEVNNHPANADPKADEAEEDGDSTGPGRTSQGESDLKTTDSEGEEDESDPADPAQPDRAMKSDGDGLEGDEASSGNTSNQDTVEEQDEQGDETGAEEGQTDEADESKKGLPPPIPESTSEIDFTTRAEPVRAEAGAARAQKNERDMDRWKELMLDRKNRLEKRKGRLIGGKKRGFNATVAGEVVPNMEEMTTKMKARVKGTPEFERRKKVMAEMIQKLKERRTVKKAVLGSGASLNAKEFPLHVEPQKRNFVEKQMEKVPIIKRLFQMSPEAENVLDASISFIHGLKFNVFQSRDKPLSPRRKEALSDWLDLLTVSLPPEWGLHHLIDELRSKLDVVSTTSAALDSVLSNYDLSQMTWSKSCTKRKPGGFSCGFWKLLHIASIGVAEHRGGSSLIETGVADPSTRVFSPAEAAEVWSAYMEFFYPCQECQKEFLTQYRDCKFRRCVRLKKSAVGASVADWKEFAKYVWEVHNSVNVLVAVKRAKIAGNGPLSPKQQEHSEVQALFPSIEQCFACFKDDGTWNEEAVFLYLEKIYWSSVEDPNMDRMLKYDTDVYYRASHLRSLKFMVFIALVSLLVARRLINKAGLQRSVLMANSLVSRHVVRHAMGGKYRSV